MYVLDHAKELSVNADKLILAGDSAGRLGNKLHTVETSTSLTRGFGLLVFKEETPLW